MTKNQPKTWFIDFDGTLTAYAHNLERDKGIDLSLFV
jgi:trehalose-6-phosphatase